MTNRRLFVMLTCLILSLSFILGACGGNTGDTPSKDSGPEASGGHGGYDQANDKYFVNMPDISWDKKEFNVLVLDNTKETTYYSEEVGVDKYDTTDDALEEAVRNRNNVIQEKYGVTINAVYSSTNVATDVDTDVKSSSGLYDMAMPFLMGCTTLAQSGDIYDLKSEQISKYIDLSMPWWDNNATQSLSVDNKVYFTTGDISIMQKIVSIAVAFNKKMLKDNFPDVDMYQMVKDGKWTFDKMIEMSKKITKDSDGNGTYTYKDTWGLTTAYGHWVPWTRRYPEFFRSSSR
jgi:hypothetical protein